MASDATLPDVVSSGRVAADDSVLIRHTTKVFIEALGAILAGIALLVGFLAWRLAYEGPIHVRFVAPYIERSVGAAGKDFVLGIEDTVITWAGWPRGLDVRAINVHVRDRRNRDLAVLPEVSLTFSARAMLHGLIAPSKIEILSPDLNLLRRHDGALMFGVQKLANNASPGVATGPQETPAGGSGPGPGQGLTLAQVVEDLLNDTGPGRPAGYLRSISIVDGRARIEDRTADIDWKAEHINFDITRSRREGGLSGNISAELPQFGAPALVTATMNVDPSFASANLDAAFQGVDLSSLGLVETGLIELSSSSVVLSGRMHTTLGIDGAVGPIEFQMNTAGGVLDLAGRIKQPIPIKLLQVNGKIEPAADKLILDRLALDIGGPSIELSGEADGSFAGKAADGGLPIVKLKVKASKFPAAWMDRYWPEGAADNTRAWLVPNIPQGMVDEVSADVTLRLPGADGTPAKVESVSGKMSTSGLEVHYLRPMPPITDGTATATFDSKSFNANITGGHVGNIKIQKGYLHITGLDAEDQFIKVGGDVTGSLPDALSLINNPRLGYASKLGLKPENSGGDAKATIDFDFPAEKSLSFDRVKIAVDALVQHAAMKQIRFNQDVTDGTLSLKLDQDGMVVSGPVVYGGMPLDVAWTEAFGDKADVRETFSAKGPTTTEGRAALGYDFRPWVDGPSDFTLKFTRHDDGRGVLETSFDLTKAALDLDFLLWKKDPGKPAKGSMVLDLDNDRAVDIRNFSIAGDGFAAAGSATFAPDGKNIDKVKLTKAAFGKSALADVAADFSHGGIAVTVGAGTMDVEPWMDARDAPVSNATLDAEELKPQKPFSITGKLAQVRLSEGKALTDVTFDLRHDPIWWDKIFFAGKLPGGAPINFNYAPGDPGTHRLKVETDDAGGAFRTLGIYDSIKGGKLQVTGEAKDNAPHRALTGRLKMSSFRLLHTPFAVRFLSVAALTGLVDALTGEGFLFSGASAKFTKTRGKIDVADFHSAGPSIGLTSKGSIDLDANTIDLKGALVPAYALNSILGNIPVVGEFLQGGKGEGMFSATYTISGDLTEPKIDVNGWSALAPGFLRNLFSGDNTAPLTERPEPKRNN
jgi:hypothetical protein